MAKRFIYVMQHSPSGEQSAEVAATGAEAVELADKALLNVPDDPSLGREWFEQRAAEVETAVGGFGPDDVVMAMGQAQLACAIQARARRAGAQIVESVTKRDSREVTLPDGSVEKKSIFIHQGFREVHDYS